MKIDKTVLRETKYMMLWTAVFSLFMQAVFLIIRAWDLTVLSGNLLGYVAVNLNFLLMGLTVQKAVNKDEKDAKALMRASQAMRTFMIFVFALIGVLFAVFNTWSFIITLFFPRLALAIKPIADKKALSGSEDSSDNP